MQNVAEINQSESDKIQWVTLATVTLFHVMAVWALFSFSWSNLLAAVITSIFYINTSTAKMLMN